MGGKNSSVLEDTTPKATSPDDNVNLLSTAPPPESEPTFELGKHLDTLRETGILTDVTLVCGKDQVPFQAHKVILSGSSKYFQQMFSSEWGEDQSGKVELPTIEPEEMEVILPFLYTGKYKDIQETSLLNKVLHASHVLQINPLVNWCCNRLAKGLSVSSFLETCSLADTLSNDVLMAHIVSFVSQHITEIAETEDFLNLSQHQMKTIVQQINPDRSSTDSLLKGLLRWAEVEKNGENREEFLLQIVMTLKLEYLSTEYLTTLLRKNIVRKNYHFLLLLDNEAVVRIFNSVTIKENPSEVKILVFGKGDDDSTAKTYDVIRDKWSESKVLPFSMELGMSACWFEGYVYVFGDSERVGNKLTVSDRILKYCPSTNTVRSYRKLLLPLGIPTPGVLDESIYVVEGRWMSNRPNTVQRYHPRSNTCEMVPEPHANHLQPSVFIRKNRLHLVSYAGNEDNLLVEYYDPEHNDWTIVNADDRDSPFMCNAALCGEKLFYIPICETREYELFDFCSQTWETKQFKGRQYQLRALNSATIRGKEVVVALTRGGLLYFYDVESEEWSVISDSGLGKRTDDKGKCTDLHDDKEKCTDLQDDKNIVFMCSNLLS